MDIIQGLLETENAGRLGWRIVNNNGVMGIYNNRTSNVSFSILNNGAIGASSNIPSNIISSYSNINVITNYTSSSGGGGGSSQWTTAGTEIYYNLGNVGIGTIDPAAPLHIYSDTPVLPAEISVVGATSTIIGTTERCIQFPYSGSGATKDYTFTTTEGLVADILIVGGGGGGGRRHAGAGGAGTLMYHKNIILNGTYNIKVGKGGAGNPAGAPNTGTASEGNFSQFTRSDGLQNYYAVGGGKGASGGSTPATTNGGQGYLYDANLTLSSANIFNSVAIAVSNKQYVNTLSSPEGCRGNIGGIEITNYKGGGGGGAGGVGMSHDAEATVNDGYGGLGLAVDITGANVVYAGGGNGSDFDGSVSQVFNPAYPTIQSRGGGGFGSDNGTPQNGLDGTGGGGGAQGNDTAGGGNGGSGIVIIRYRKATSNSSARLLLDTTTTGTAIAEFRRGTGADMQNDYRFINDTDGTIKLQFENSTQAFSNLSANLVWFSSNDTIIHKNTAINGRVGIGTTYHATRSLDVLGSANISGTVSVGGLSVLSSNAIITNSLSSNVSLTIHNGFPPPAPPITSSPSATDTGVAGSYAYQVFTYTTETAGAGTGQSLYTITVSAGGVVCDVLVVGGGGGGGGGHGGGGGAGQLVLIHQTTLNAGTYTIKVGKGGVRGTNPSSGGVEPTKGSNSSFDYVIAEGGGANGGNALKDGGSGAGGDSWLNGLGVKGKGLKNSTVDTYSSGTVYSRGNDGGEGGTDPGQGAGGGGAGTAGGNGTNSHTNGGPGNGGDGLSGISAIGYDFKTNFGTNVGKLETDNLIYFAGGGGGGAWIQSVVAIGGKGGGGNGGSGSGGTDNGKDATNNTGSGGGGGSANYGAGGAGGSGIVIIRYLSTITSSSIELVRGTTADANRDYKLGNYNSEFKVVSSVSSIDTDYIRITTAGAIFNPTGTASWNIGSDRRIKENIERASYDKCYENINKLELNRFNYVEGFNTVSRDNKQLGFIAQEVYDLFPKAISSHEYNTDTLSIPNLLSIDVSQINYSLYGAVKKLIEINKEKDERIKTLGYQLKTLETFLNIAVDTSSNVMADTSNISLDTSNILDTSSNIVIDISSNIVIETSSNIVLDTSNITIDTSNISIDTSNILDTSSNIALDTSNIAIDTSNIIMDTSNIAIDTSNISIDTSNIVMDTSSNISLDTSNISLDTSNIVMDTSNIVMDTSSNIAIDTSNIALDTSSNISIDTSNIALDTSNIILDTSSNISIDTSNIILDTSNITLDTSNITLDTLVFQ
jgi:hypothetical protein